MHMSYLYITLLVNTYDDESLLSYTSGNFGLILNILFLLAQYARANRTSCNQIISLIIGHHGQTNIK